MYEDQFRVVGTVVGSGLGKAKTGNDQLCVQFEYVKDGEPRRVCWYGYFSSEKAIEISDKGLQGMGWDPAEHAYSYHLLNGQGDENPLIGRKAELVLGLEQDLEGNDKLKVKFVNALGGGIGIKERMSETDAQAFSARMRARIGGATVGTPRPKPAGAAPAAPAAVPAPARRAPAAPAGRAPQPKPAAPAEDAGDDIIPF